MEKNEISVITKRNRIKTIQNMREKSQSSCSVIMEMFLMKNWMSRLAKMFHLIA